MRWSSADEMLMESEFFMQRSMLPSVSQNDVLSMIVH